MLDCVQQEAHAKHGSDDGQLIGEETPDTVRSAVMPMGLKQAGTVIHSQHVPPPLMSPDASIGRPAESFPFDDFAVLWPNERRYAENPSGNVNNASRSKTCHTLGDRFSYLPESPTTAAWPTKDSSSKARPVSIPQSTSPLTASNRSGDSVYHHALSTASYQSKLGGSGLFGTVTTDLGALFVNDFDTDLRDSDPSDPKPAGSESAARNQKKKFLPL